MKYILLFVMILCMVFSFNGCSKIDVVKNSNIITALAVYKSGDMNCYTFMKTTSSPSDKDDNKSEKYKMYDFKASSFNAALCEFEKHLGKADFGHLSMILSDIEYLNEYIVKDIEQIRNKINVSPLIKYFIAGDNCRNTLEYIGKVNDGNPEKFIENSYANKRKFYLCTMSELLLAVKNKYYTASVPVIGMPENNIGEIIENKGAVLYSCVSGTLPVCYRDYDMYCDYIDLGGKKAGFIDTAIKGNKLYVNINSKSYRKANVVTLANRCKDMGYDLLNSVYYCKKNFLTYNSYEKFLEKLYMYDIIIE